MFFLSAFFYSFIYLCLHACNSIHINSVQHGTKTHSTQNERGWLATRGADQAARCANRNMVWTEAQFPSSTYKQPPLYNAQHAAIQAKKAKLYPEIPSYKQTAIGTVEVKGIMPKVREYAYKLCEYVLAMKIALEQPGLVVNRNVVYIAQSITHYATFIFDREDLTHYVHTILQHVAPTIDKHYSRHIADFVLNASGATPAYNMSSSHIMSMLQSMLTYAHATINEIDSKYHETDEVFFTADQFEWLRNKAYNAFAKANDANKKVHSVWEPILAHRCSLQALQGAFDYTLDARSAAKNARMAYRHFAEYFDQFTPTIQTMLNDCNAFVHTRQPAVDNYTACLRTYLNDMIKIIQSDLQEALDRLSEMIWSAHQAANQYNHSYDQYSRFIDNMKYTVCAYLPNPWYQLKK